jgi:hypothetical protein
MVKNYSPILDTNLANARFLLWTKGYKTYLKICIPLSITPYNVLWLLNPHIFTDKMVKTQYLNKDQENKPTEDIFSAY